MSGIRRAQTVAHSPSATSELRSRSDSHGSTRPLSDDTTSPAQPTTRRRRDLLKNYYGLQESSEPSNNDKPQSPSTTNSPAKLSKSQSGWAKRSDPLNPDTETYHPELAYNMMVKELGLKDLIRKDNELVNEIKELDGNMKTLVYGNYSRFISATDTIRKMKSSADDMETQIALLEQNVAAISSSAETLHSGFSSQRSKIHQLSGVSILIKKLHFVFELPAKLQSCIKKKQYAQSIITYAKTSALLNHYSHSPVFEQINQECASLLSEVSKRAVDKLLSKKWSKPTEITETVGIIVGAGLCPASDVINDFLQEMDQELRRLLQSCKSELFSSRVALSNPESDQTHGEKHIVQTENGVLVNEKLAQLNRSFLGELASFIDAFNAFFVEQRLLSSKATNETPFYSSTTLEALKNHVSAKNFSDDDRKRAREDMKGFLEGIEGAYFDVMNETLKLPRDLNKISPSAYITVLDALKQDVSQYSPVLDITTVPQRFAEMTVQILDQIISGVFENVKKEFFVKLKEIKPAEMDVFTATRQLINWIKEALIVTALPILEKFASSDSKSSEAATKKHNMLNRIRVTLFQFWANLGDDMVDSHLQRDSELQSQHTLILSRLALEWSRGAIESIFSMYSQRLFGDGPTTEMSPDGGKRSRGPSATMDSNMAEEIMNSGRDVATHYKQIGQVLLRKYAMQHINKTTLSIRLCVSSLSLLQADSENQDPSPVWIEFLSDLERVEKEIVKAFEDDGDGGKRRAENNKLKPKGAQSRSGNLRGSSSATYLPSGGSGGPLGRSLTTVGRLSNITSSSGGAPRRDALLANIDKLFQERLEYLQPKLEFSRTAVVDAIARTVLKTWVEELRFIVLSTAAFDQVQRDITFWKDHLWAFLPDDTAFQSCMDELSTITYMRCISPLSEMTN